MHRQTTEITYKPRDIYRHWLLQADSKHRADVNLCNLWH